MISMYPKYICENTLWDFHDKKVYSDKNEFFEDVREYHINVSEYAPDIHVNECWYPDVNVIALSSIKIIYIYLDRSNRIIEKELYLKNNDGSSFTNGDLLFQIHNSIVKSLQGLAHTHFEGLIFKEIDDNGVPIYELNLGS